MKKAAISPARVSFTSRMNMKDASAARPPKMGGVNTQASRTAVGTFSALSAQ